VKLAASSSAIAAGPAAWKKGERSIWAVWRFVWGIGRSFRERAAMAGVAIDLYQLIYRRASMSPLFQLGLVENYANRRAIH
jgi:hypothetical protein